MPISQKQLEANRLNAQKGGVKTPEGKAISKYNALKHGLLSREVLLNDENEADLLALGKAIRSEMQPATEFELILVDRITANVWRLKRAMLIERQMMEEGREDVLGGPRTLGHALLMNTFKETLEKLMRYEASLERGIYKAVHELERVRAIRSGDTVVPPLAIDISEAGE
jgi:hypothetical protein